ncbi:UNKNOWN [Stylonychia lemnae]|uniref:Uncharacterized protein n=1 Tax=Stylonychia lemnae TaxID=5949 RepID=A0A077ZXY6_STYLE|nr:UNKNOWN [Stylonychia lemnae]|eukprot:CDW74462.1 UNKNOWN [Stylonychia lemnae]
MFYEHRKTSDSLDESYQVDHKYSITDNQLDETDINTNSRSPDFLKVQADIVYDSGFDYPKSNRKHNSNQYFLRDSKESIQHIQQDTKNHYRNLTILKNQNNVQSIAVNMGSGVIGTGGFSGGGFDHDLECEETDFKYLDEVIFKVKEGLEQQYQLSDYIEALLQEINIEINEEWEAIIAEAKENYKTHKKLIDISCKQYFLIPQSTLAFLLERTQVSVTEGKGLQALNNNLLKEISRVKEQNDFLVEELKGLQVKNKNQNEALRQQDKTIQSMNEQIQYQLDMIRKLEKDSIVSNPSSARNSLLKPGEYPDFQNQLNEKNKKIEEIEQYLSEQTSNYHSEVYKNQNLQALLKKQKEENSLLKDQIEQLQYFMEEKDDRIIEIEGQYRMIEEQLTRKEYEIKNMVTNVNQSSGMMMRPYNKIQMSIDNLPKFQHHHQNSIQDLSQSYQSNIENTVGHRRKVFNLCGSSQKWSQELETAVNKLKSTKNSFMQRSFIVQQSIKEITRAHHKRMQTITSNEVRNSYSNFDIQQENSELINSPEFNKRQNKTLMGQDYIIKVSESKDESNPSNNTNTHVLRIEDFSPNYKSSNKVDFLKVYQSEESKFDINDHISPRKSNPYSNFNEDGEDEVDEEDDEQLEDEDVVNLNTARKSKSSKNKTNQLSTQKSNLIGINESQLMEFGDNSNNLGATYADQSNFDYAEKIDESKASIKFNRNQKQQSQNERNQGSSATTKDTKELRDQLNESPNSLRVLPQIVTVNNYNINQKIDINNFLSDVQNYGSFQQNLTNNTNNNTFDKKSQRNTTKQNKNQNNTSKINLKSNKQQNDKNTTLNESVILKNRKVLESLQSFGIKQAKNMKASPKQQMEEIKLDFYKDQISGLQIGNQLSEKSFRSIKQNYSDLNLMTVDAEDIEDVQRTYLISQLEQNNERSMLVQEAVNSKICIEDINQRISKMQKDALLEYFIITVLAFIMKHPKRTSLLEIDKLKLYQSAIKNNIPFYKWNRWIEKKMIEIYHERKRVKNAQLRTTFFDPKSWFGKLKKNQSQDYQVIEDFYKSK